MKKAGNLLITAVLLLLMFAGCSSDTKVLRREENDNGKKSVPSKFEIYLVKNSDGSMMNMSDIYKLSGENLDSLCLDEKPVLTDEDITAYYWNASEDRKTNEGLSLGGKYVDMMELNDKDILKNRISGTKHSPFVVVVNGERIYLGCFYSLLSSWSSPRNISIYIEMLGLDQRDFRLCVEDSSVKLLHDKRIYDAIKNLDKLIEENKKQ